MNGTKNLIFPKNRLMKWPVLCGLAGLLLVQTVPAGQQFYVNNAVVANAPNIDATNFINNNSFTSLSGSLYETTDTLNYTNNGTMNGSGGFLFDTLTFGSPGGRSMASSFYNPGSITGAEIIVSATNLVSPGTLNEGENGLIQLTGQNVDLSYATLVMPLPTGSINLPGTGDFGTDTNGDWDPSLALTPTSAYSSEPNFFIASPSVAYSETDAVGTNVSIIRAIFLSNLNTNVGTQVFFGQVAFGGGAGNVEWTGVYTNPVTGLPSTNYLILNNDYVLGASTNVNLSQGYPNNFTFSTDPNTVAGLTPASIALPSYPAGAISNVYSYASVQVVPTTVSPGPTAQNPSGAITNIPGRIQISAGKELNLALANVFGPNYLSLTCTNQFDGSIGATIISPYSDISLGVTNGSLVVSNMLQSVLPSLSGTIQAWSTEFFFANTNSGSTVTDDFRVLIVSSSLIPFSTPQVQNLTLHSTNLVISDVLNIMKSVSIDAQSLTLTTNVGYPNNGSGSPDGELNITNLNIFFASSLPNLLWLTNNGKITLANAGIFGGPSPANYQNFINRGLLSDQGSTIYSTYFFNSGTIANGSGNFFLQSQSTFLTNGSITAVGDIAITATNLVASKVQIQAGRSLTLQATNLLTDGGAANFWSVGASSLNGLNLPVLPAAGDLTNTTIYVLAAANKNVVNTWAGADRGTNGTGYLNDVALGGLILDARSVPPHSLFTFNPATGSNAMYVVNLYLTNTAAALNFAGQTASALSISPGMAIYYQNAYSNGVPVSSTINNWNNGQLRWVTPADLLSAARSIVMVQPKDPPNSFSFQISGVQLSSGALATGVTYQVVIEAATNLLSPNWVNVYTGTPPFNFNDFGFTTNHQRFYRAKQGW
jgi:hypothetical protein